MAEDLIIRPYRPGDEEGINALFNRVLGKRRPIEKWRWMYAENPASRDTAQWVTVAERDGRIVGHYASWALKFKVGEKEVLAGEPVDTVIDPGFRSGIEFLLRLVSEHASCNHGAASFAFGFPNDAVYAVGKRFLGYRDLGVMEHRMRRLSIRSAVKRRLRLPRPALWLVDWTSRACFSLSIAAIRAGADGVTVRRAGKFDSRVDELWEKEKGRYGITAVRRSEYLNWRYGFGSYDVLLAEKGPALSGYAVLKTEEREGTKAGLIMDLFASEDSTMALLKASLGYLSGEGADYALCGIMKGDRLAGPLERCGFAPNDGFPPLPVVYLPIGNGIDGGYIGDQANWHLVYGDKER